MNIVSKELPEEFAQSAKMDSYSGSEPRLFISFRLDNEFNGQPLQLSAAEERMETNESFVTASSSSHVENPTLSSDR